MKALNFGKINLIYLAVFLSFFHSPSPGFGAESFEKKLFQIFKFHPKKFPGKFEVFPFDLTEKEIRIWGHLQTWGYSKTPEEKNDIPVYLAMVLFNSEEEALKTNSPRQSLSWGIFSHHTINPSPFTAAGSSGWRDSLVEIYSGFTRGIPSKKINCYFTWFVYKKFKIKYSESFRSDSEKNQKELEVIDFEMLKIKSLIDLFWNLKTLHVYALKGVELSLKDFEELITNIQEKKWNSLEKKLKEIYSKFGIFYSWWRSDPKKTVNFNEMFEAINFLKIH